MRDWAGDRDCATMIPDFAFTPVTGTVTDPSISRT